MLKVLCTILVLAAGAFAATPTPPATTITLSAQTIRFTYAGGPKMPEPIGVTLKSNKTGLTYTATVGSASWLIPVSPLTGPIPAALSFRVNPSSLQAGTYSTDVTFTATGVPDPVKLTITLVVKGATPNLAVSPATMEFEHFTAAMPPPGQKLSIASSGQSVSVSLAIVGAPWAKLAKNAGFAVAGAPLIVGVDLDAALVTAALPGTYTGTISVTPNDPDVKVVKVAVRLVVKPGKPVLSTLWPAKVPKTTNPISVTITGANLLKQTKVVVDGTELTEGVTWVSSSVLLVAMPASVLGAELVHKVKLRNDATDSDTELDFEVIPEGPFLAGIANAASFDSALKVSSGEILCVFGSTLGPADFLSGEVSGGAYTKILADTKVQFHDGTTFIDAPILFGSPNQINVVVPYGLSGTTRLQVVSGATSGSPKTSDPINGITVDTATPGVFTLEGNGQGQAAAVNVVTTGGVQTRTLNSAKNAVPKESILEVYVTGVGTVTGTTDGQIIAASPAVAVPGVSVTIGNINCPATAYAVPEAVRGLVQVNVTVPADVPVGTAQPMVVSFGGKASQTVTVAVK